MSYTWLGRMYKEKRADKRVGINFTIWKWFPYTALGSATTQHDWFLLITIKSISVAENVFLCTKPTAKNFFSASLSACFHNVVFYPNFKLWKEEFRANEDFMCAHLAAFCILTADIWGMCTDLCCACGIAWIEMYTPSALPAWCEPAYEPPSCRVCVGCLLLTALSLYFAPHLPPFHTTEVSDFFMCVCACRG